jgi:hypothetical protein
MCAGRAAAHSYICSCVRHDNRQIQLYKIHVHVWDSLSTRVLTPDPRTLVQPRTLEKIQYGNIYSTQPDKPGRSPEFECVLE